MKLFEQILEKKLILTTGKGGIGKTTVAAALGQYAASRGRKVCLVESSSSDQLSPLFGLDPVGHHLTEVSSGVHVINLQPAQNFRDFVVIHLGFAKLFEKVFTQAIVQSFITMLPGITELTLLGRLFYFAELDEKHNFDHVIFDGYASGHFLSLLKTPDAVLNSGMVGPVIAETKRVRDYLLNPDKTAIVVVAMLEELIISESIELIRNLKAELNLAPLALLLNRCLPSLLQDASDDPGGDLEPAIHEYFQSKRSRQLEALRKLNDGLQADNNRREKDYPVQLLIDCGFLPEPLTQEFANRWLQGSRTHQERKAY